MRSTLKSTGTPLFDDQGKLIKWRGVDKKIPVAQVVKDEAETHADFEDFVEEGPEPATKAASLPTHNATASSGRAGSLALLLVAWTAVGVPLSWGVWITLLKTAALFH